MQLEVYPTTIAQNEVWFHSALVSASTTSDEVIAIGAHRVQVGEGAPHQSVEF